MYTVHITYAHIHNVTVHVKVRYTEREHDD